MFNSCILGDILLMALKLLLMLNYQLGDFVTFSTPLLQSCLTVQKMKPLVVLFLFWLHAGPQWISVGCGRTLISWTRTLYMLQIVQCSLSLELRGTWDMALFPFIPPTSSAVPAIRWSCPSIHLILQSLEQNTKSAGFHICQIPFWSSPPPRRELFDLFSIMACSALTGAASFIIPPTQLR